MAPVHMLMGQSMELALKSYLMARGIQLDDLKRRPYGHDLNALLEKAMALNIQRLVELHSFNINAIQMLAPTYGNHEFRYIVTGTKSIPQWGFLSITARALTHGLHDLLLRRRVGKVAAQKRIALRGKF